jgi:AcrR family transcriptional regulator
VFKSVRKLVKRSRKRRRRLKSAQRRSTLLRVGRHLLAKADYDRISVAKFASTSGCSVGAFYGRFRNKNTYLINVIISTFDAASAAAERELDPRRWRDASNVAVVHQIVYHVVNTMRDETAGAARAALKRASVDPSACEPLFSYRSIVTEHAISLLEPRLPKSIGPRETIRTVMQIVHATVADSLFQNGGPLRSGSPLMINELSELARRRLGVRKTN